MSQVRARNRRSCKACDEYFHDGYNGAYCSEECYLRAKGTKLLNCIRHDHTTCIQCGTQLKEIEEPTDEALRQIDGYHSTTSVIGFQYRTESAATGEKVIERDSGERITTGTICGDCGNTSHYQEFPEWQDRKLFEYASGIIDTLAAKEDEHHTDIPEALFFEALLATEDIELSLGIAIEKQLSFMDG